MEENKSRNSEEFEKLYDEIAEIKEGDIVKGKIIKINVDSIIVDIGFKSEGVIPLDEFNILKNDINIKIGDEIDVLLEKKEAYEGRPVISFRKVISIKDWERLENAYKMQEIVSAKIIRKVKGGYKVDLGRIPDDISGFLPLSHAGYPPVKNFDELKNKVVPVRVIEFSYGKEVVVSWRLVVEDAVKRKKKEIFERIKKTPIIKGRIKKVTKGGAVIDIDSVIEGFLSREDISWGRISRVEDVLRVDEEIEVKVLSFDEKNERLSFGLKQITVHPWENIDEKYKTGQVVTGKVVSLTSYGAFVEIEPGIDGLIHISEMSWTKDVRHPKEILKKGDIVQAKILKIDKEKKKLSVGLKQIYPNPWLIVKNKYPVGSRLTGTITHLTPFGAFVKLEEGVEGMIHVSDISWVKKIHHPKEVLRKGLQVEVVVLNVNPERERIALGLKQKEENPFKKYKIGSNIETEIVKIDKSGLKVKLEKGIFGFIPINQLSIKKIDSPLGIFEIHKFVWAKITKVDMNKKEIELSIKSYEKERERLEIEKYINQDTTLPSIGDVIRMKKEIENNESNDEGFD